MRLAAPGLDDQALDLAGQLVGVAHRPPRAVAELFQALVLVAFEDLVAGLARDPELTAHLAHAFPRPEGERRNEDVPPSLNTLSTASTPPAKSQKCSPCPVRIVTYVSRRAKFNKACHHSLFRFPGAETELIRPRLAVTAWLQVRSDFDA
jgi:hypothetical protein